MTTEAIPEQPTSRAIMDALGGYRVVAAKLGVDPASAHNWTRERRGIPAHYWPQIVGLGAEASLGWITFDLLRKLNPPRGHAQQQPATPEAA
jgi:hypothetical protein